MEEKTNAEHTTVRSAISDKIYGEIPPRPVHLSYVTKSCNPRYAAGKARLSEIEIIMDFGEKEAVLPIKAIIPNKDAPCSAIVFLSREESVPSEFLPAEEIIDRGYAIINLCIDKVSGAGNSAKTGIGKYISSSRRKRNAAGRIALWAWAAMRAVDYLCDRDIVDKSSIIIAGHGISAECALLCGAFDERISCVIANEPFADDFRSASGREYLYCPAFADEPRTDGISLLVGLCRGKKILIGSACDRAYADNNYESDLLRKIGVPEVDMFEPCMTESATMHYHRRGGGEYFSREDWKYYLDFIEKAIF